MGSGALSRQGLAMTPEEFWRILHDAPEPKPVFFRLYHDDQGHPIIYSMENLSGNYIDVDSEIFARGSMDVRVVDGRLILIDRHNHATKLRPNHEHGTPCHPQDVCVIVDNHAPHIKWSTL